MGQDSWGKSILAKWSTRIINTSWVIEQSQKPSPQNAISRESYLIESRYGICIYIWATKKKQLITFHYTGCYGCSIGILIIVYHNPYITGQYNRYNRLYSLNNQFFFVAHLVEFMVHVGPCLQTVWIVKAIRVTHFLPGLFGQFRPLNRHGRGSNFPTNFPTSSVKGSMRIPVQFMPCSKA